jgi:hypothetical protein
MLVKVPYGWKKLGTPLTMRVSLNQANIFAVQVPKCRARVAPVWPGAVVRGDVAMAERAI